MIRSLARALPVGRAARGRTRRLATISLLVISLASFSGVASASTVNTANQSPSADWWIWAAGLPSGDPTCGVTGQGSLFFVSEIASTQKCTVASGQTVLAAVINFEWSATEAVQPANSAYPPICHVTAQSALLACANWQANQVTETNATLDGTPLPIVKLTASAFTETWAYNNYFGVPPGPTPAAAAGYYVLLPPLTRGSHTLKVSGSADFMATLGFTYTPTATIHLLQR